MAQTDKKTILTSRLRQEIRQPIELLAGQLLGDLGENLLSLCVVGSATTEDFHPQRSDINTVVVVRQRSHQLLQLLAGYGGKLGKMKLRAPLLMTPEYIERSRDVFAVEFLDFQLNHAVVFGVDPFADLKFEKEDVRLQCERQLKAALIKLRQGYIRSLGQAKLVAGLLLGCAAELVVLLRAMLWLQDIDRPGTAMATIEKAAQQFEFDQVKIAALVSLKQQHRPIPKEQVEQMFQDVYQVIDHLSRGVDQMAEKS